MVKIKYDNNPRYGGLINFASNAPENNDISKAKMQAFDYGFRIGWQICWYEHNNRSIISDAKK